MKRFLRVYLTAITLVISTFQAECQIINEGFEGSFPPAGWTIQNYSNNPNSFVQYSWENHSGSYSAAVFPVQSAANNWMFTAPLSLTAGKTYELKYWVKTDINTAFKVSLKSTNTIGGAEKILRNSFTSGSWVESKDTITCEQSGIYYVGFNNYSTNLTQCGSMVDDITFTDMNFSTCAAVTAGVVTAGASSVCPNTAFTLTSTGATANSFGVRYSWQKSPDGISWTNITNGFTNSSTLQVTQTGATYYRYTDTCTLSGQSAVSNQILVSTASFLNCYCTPAVINCFSNYAFTNVTIVNSAINNTSTCSTNGYGNFTALGAAAAYRNQSIFLRHTITSGNATPYTVGVWLDANQNGIFESSEFSLNGPFSVGTNTSQIVVPAGAASGNTRVRLRVRASYSTDAQPFLTGADACNADARNGETEDYLVNISDAADCSGSVQAGTISANANVCPNNTFYLSTTNATVNRAQMRYAWQRSADNVNWTNINNTSYLINPLSVSQNTATFYRLTDTCLVSGQSAVSNSISPGQNNVFGCYCTPLTSNCTTIGIEEVSFNTILNASTCGTNGYTNYTSTISTTVNNGSIYPVTVKLRPATSTRYVTIWIDNNRNGTLETNETMFSASTSSNIVNGSISMPFNIPAGEALMRVSVSTNSFMTMCGNGGNGETEDYKLVFNIVNPVNNKYAYYVKQTATGANTGADWNNAFTSLAVAFGTAHAGDTIKVAKGVYTAGTLQTNVFSLKDSLIVWGGYPDFGNPANSQRDFSAYQSVMSGEIGAAGSATDNTKILLRGENVKGFVVDGFIIENAFSSGTALADYGPIVFTNASGKLKNCVVRKNHNESFGAGMNVRNSTIKVDNCFLIENSSGTWNQNQGLLNLTVSGVDITNSVIAKNKTYMLLNQKNSAVNILSSTVFKNYGISKLYDTSQLAVRNSIFHLNGVNLLVDTAEFATDWYSTVNIQHSITGIVNSSSSSHIGGDPKFIDSSRIEGIDNKFFTTDDGLRLLNPCSPAINTGNNAFVAAVPSDIAGAPRIMNGNADLGAYEVQQPQTAVPAVLYVNRLATGLNNGLSWQNAFTDLQSAFRSCSDSIKVAKGTYFVSASDPLASFSLDNGRVVMGGFPASGNPTNADIDPVTNPTVLDGTVSGTIRSKCVVSSLGNTSNTKLIGFEIVNASDPEPLSNNATLKISLRSKAYFESIKLNGVSNRASQLVEVSHYSDPTLYKCTFFSGFTSQGSWDGARLISVRSGSAPVFRKSFFGRDTTAAVTPDYGARLIFENSAGLIDSCSFSRTGHNSLILKQSAPTVQHTLFHKVVGRDVYIEGGSPAFDDCRFIDTTFLLDDFDGGSVAILNGANAGFAKCVFVGSLSHKSGGAIYGDHADADIRNCVFYHCRSYLGGGAVHNISGKMKIENCYSYFLYPDPEPQANETQFLTATGGGSSSTVINTTVITGSLTAKQAFRMITPTDTLRLYNSISWRFGSLGQLLNIAEDIMVPAGSTVATCDVRNSMLFRQSGIPLTNTTTGVSPKFLDAANPAGSDQLFYTSDDGLQLCSCSPGINTGASALSAAVTDVRGLPRVFGGNIDKGAFELQAGVTTDKSFFVKSGAAPGGNGLSWATAYNKLQDAIANACADTIRISKGLYKPAVASRDSSFDIFNRKAVYGGFPDQGNPTDADRNTVLYPTVLSGDIGVPGDSTDNSYNVVFLHCPDTTVVLDGLTIERGTANGTPTNNYTYDRRRTGGGLYMHGNASVTVNNCIVQNNYAVTGGGMVLTGTTANILKSVIRNNNASSGGGFLTSDAYSTFNGGPGTPYVSFRNSVIADCKGGAGEITGYMGSTVVQNFKFENVIFYRNEFAGTAGLTINGAGSVKVTNCIFAKNNNLGFFYAGVGIRASSSGLFTYVYNSVFKENTTFGLSTGTENPDFNWQTGTSSSQLTNPIPPQNFMYSALSQANQTGSSSPGNIFGATFRDINDGPGPDGIWMTSDDGLLPGPCSPTIDNGNNTYVSAIPQDILGNARITGPKVDMGAYEIATQTPVTPQATIVASANPVCPGTNVTFTATVTGVNSATTYQWKKNGIVVGPPSSIYATNTLVDGDVITVTATINNTCVSTQTVTSNAITMQVTSSLTASVSITASANPICTGNQVTFTSTPVNGGASPSFQWKRNNVNVGGNSPTYTFLSLNNNDQVHVVMTSSLSCAAPATSNVITMTVNATTPTSVSIAANNNPGCAGSPISFTATPVNAGTSPAYQWQVNGVNAGTNSATFTSSSLSNNDVVRCLVTGNSTCSSNNNATSNSVTVSITSSVTPSISISTGGTNVCAGASVTFTAVASNGGTSPAYQWKVNGVNAGTNSTTFTTATLANGDVISCMLTSNASCAATTTATSNNISMTVASAVTPVVTVSNSPAFPVCAGSSVSFTASVTGGGASPVYQWKINGSNAGTNSAILTTSALSNNDVVTVVVTSSLACASPATVTSSAITAVVAAGSVANAGPDVSICPSGNTQLSGSGGSTFSWSPSTGLSNPNIANPIAAPAATTTYTLTVSNGVCTSSDAVTVTVLQPGPPSVTISTASTSVCQGANVTFNATGTGLGSTPVYQWTVNGVNAGTNSASFTSSQLSNNAQVKVIVSGNNGCASFSNVQSNTLTITTATLAEPVIDLNNGTFTVTNPDAAATYTWQINNGTQWVNVTPVANGLSFTPAAAGNYRVTAVKGGCTKSSGPLASSFAAPAAPDPTLIYIGLYPNPAQSRITVNMINPMQHWLTLEIMNLQGQKLYPAVNIAGRTEVEADVSTLPAGIYFVKLIREDGMVRTLRFVKL